MGEGNGTVGGITVALSPASNTFWQTPILDQTDFAGDTGNIGDDSPDAGAGAYIAKSDMVDSSKDTYILKILARGVANARGYTGENPDLIVCPQEIYDLIENEIDPRKQVVECQSVWAQWVLLH